MDRACFRRTGQFGARFHGGRKAEVEIERVEVIQIRKPHLYMYICTAKGIPACQPLSRPDVRA